MIFHWRTIPNFLSALGRAARQTFRGPVFVPDEVLERRVAICQACIFYHPQTAQCRQCTCFVPLKASIVSEGCPIGKWPRHTPSVRERVSYSLR